MSAVVHWWPDGHDAPSSSHKTVTGAAASASPPAQTPPAQRSSPTPSPGAAVLASPAAGADTGGTPGALVFSGRQLTLRPPSNGSLFADLDTPQSSTDNTKSTSAELRYEAVDGAPTSSRGCTSTRRRA
ncbi:hypothetical protein [Streptomyces griseocarneus]|uniref:Uncharacterized protein n=1 Tax=Streptomyces griseocarneus TaxID=51201 RepID=A0ABX7RPZ3_9ACTN|nr:hypothetical protein [Streptomyces griseocarneus]QSY48926.1 hypothetical protein J3S04_28615 [Streptomyces griseocarneus]